MHGKGARAREKTVGQPVTETIRWMDASADGRAALTKTTTGMDASADAMVATQPVIKTTIGSPLLNVQAVEDKEEVSAGATIQDGTTVGPAAEPESSLHRGRNANGVENATTTGTAVDVRVAQSVEMRDTNGV